MTWKEQKEFNDKIFRQKTGKVSGGIINPDSPLSSENLKKGAVKIKDKISFGFSDLSNFVLNPVKKIVVIALIFLVLIFLIQYGSVIKSFFGKR